MKVPSIRIISGSTVLVASVLASAGFGQAPANDNPFAPSPGAKVEKATATAEVKSTPIPQKLAFLAASSAVKVEKRISDPVGMAATDIYKIGVGDVLFVNLKNSLQGFGYYKVLADGSIDYPLAGGKVRVTDLTADTVAEMLAGSIKLYKSPVVEIKISHYLSHVVTVGGLVDNGGQRNLRREAVPLFAIMAEAEVRRGATRVSIARMGSEQPESYDLKGDDIDNILIRAGDSLEFSSGPAVTSAGYFYLAGMVVSGGKRDLREGLTLSQAVADAGGTRNKANKAMVKRRDASGKTTAKEYDLRQIRAGKISDPILETGDVVEIIK